MSNQDAPNSSEDRWVIVLGKIVRIPILIGAAAILYYGLSPDISHRPIGTLTLSDIVTWAVIAAGVIWLVKLAFKSPSEEAAANWGIAGFLIILAFIGLIVYLARH